MRISNLNSFKAPILLGMLLVSLSVISQSASSEEIKTVISEGIGTDVPSALQNAAQNALTNVVGSFIDSTKILEKKVEIREGIRSETSNIDTNIKEYSQGSIKGIEIIDSSEQAGLVKVTAKILVRDEVFKIYINKIAAGEKDFSGESLFAQVATEKKQNKNKQAFVDDLIETIFKRVEFNVGLPTKIAPKELEKYSNDYGVDIKNFITKYGKENVYIFEASSSLNKEAVAEIRKILDVIGEKKEGSLNMNGGACQLFSRDFEEGDSIFTILNTATRQESGTKIPVYIIKDGKKAFDSSIENSIKTGNLSIEIIDEKGETLQKNILKPAKYYFSREGERSGSRAIVALPKNNAIALSEWSNLCCLDWSVTLFEKKVFDIFMAIDPDVIAKARKIRINVTNEEI